MVKMKKKGFFFMAKLIIGLVILALLIMWFFWPNGAFAKVKRLITGNAQPIDERPIKGPIRVEEGITFSPNMSIDAKDSFLLFMRAMHPQEVEPCLMLVSFPDWEVYKEDVRILADHEYVIDIFETDAGRQVQLVDPANRVRARISEETKKPCIVAGASASAGGNVAKNFKNCLDRNFEGCYGEKFSVVDQIKIHGREMEELDIPHWNLKRKNDVIEFEGKKWWVFYHDGIQTCFIANGGSKDGNEKGVKKSVIEDYLKRDDKKLCTR